MPARPTHRRPVTPSVAALSAAVTRARRPLLECLETRRLMHGDVNVTFNFQPQGATTPAGTIADVGFAYGNRGNGYSYGWNNDNRASARDRNMVSNQRLDTVAFMQAGGVNRSWEVEVQNGQYEVTITSGDARYRDGVHSIKAESTQVMYGIQSSKKQFLTVTKTVTVTDGRLTLSVGKDANNTKINSVTLKSTHTTPDAMPTVTIAATDASATEGGDNGAVRLTRDGVLGDAPLTVKLAWTGSAGAKDIASRPTSVTFPAGVTTVDVPIAAIDDTLDESLETAKIALAANGNPYRIGSPATASVSIVGAEPEPEPEPELPTVTVATIDGSATEGGDTGTVRFTRTGGDLSQPLSVALAWGGSATHNDVLTPTVVGFAAGSATADLAVTTKDDAVDESAETAVVSIVTFAGDPLYAIGSPSTASVLVVDNDEPEPVPQSFTNVTWAGTSSPPISYSETTTAVLGGKLYLFGGFNGVFVPQRDVYRFDGTTWQTMTQSPKAFTHTGHAEVDGNAWFAGGYIGNGSGQTFGTSEVLIYNASNDSWTTGPSLPQARASGNLVKVGSTLYFFGGESFNRTTDTTDMWALDLNNQAAGWQTKASIPLPRNHASALNIDGKIYVLAGQTSYDGTLVAHDDIQIYDPATNTWTVADQKLPAPRSHTTQSAFYYRGRILLITGESAHNVPVNTVWSIDPTTLATSVLNTFPDSRFSVAAGILNDKVYVFGGYKGYIATNAFVGTFV